MSAAAPIFKQLEKMLVRMLCDKLMEDVSRVISDMPDWQKRNGPREDIRAAIRAVAGYRPWEIVAAWARLRSYLDPIDRERNRRLASNIQAALPRQ